MADTLNIICCLTKHKWTTFSLFDSHLIALILDYWSPTLPNTPFSFQLPHPSQKMILDERRGRAWVIHASIGQIAIYSLINPQFQHIGKRGDVLVPIRQISLSGYTFLNFIVDTNQPYVFILALRRDNVLHLSIFWYCIRSLNLIRVTKTKLSNHIFGIQCTKSIDTFALYGKTSNNENDSICFVCVKDGSTSTLTSFLELPYRFDIMCSDGKEFYGFSSAHQRVFNIENLSCCSAPLIIKCHQPTQFMYDRLKQLLVLKNRHREYEFTLPDLQCNIISVETVPKNIRLMKQLRKGSRLSKCQSFIHLPK